MIEEKKKFYIPSFLILQLILLHCALAFKCFSTHSRFIHQRYRPFKLLSRKNSICEDSSIKVISKKAGKIGILSCMFFLTLNSPITATAKVVEISYPPAPVIQIMRDRYAELEAGITNLEAGIANQKVAEIRVGESLVKKLRDVDRELENLQRDIYKDEIDWNVVGVYPKIFRAYTPLFTEYTDRAFPSNSPIDTALRYALRYEIGGFFKGVKELENSITVQRQRNAQRAFAQISVAYDHYLKAGDLYTKYFADSTPEIYNKISDGSYIAPGIEAPGIADKVLVRIQRILLL